MVVHNTAVKLHTAEPLPFSEYFSQRQHPQKYAKAWYRRLSEHVEYRETGSLILLAEINVTWVFVKPPTDMCEKLLVTMLPKLTLVLKILNICYRFTETIYFHRSGDYSISLYISSLHIIIESIAFVHKTYSLKLQFYQAVSF